MFYLALTFGLEDDPPAAVARVIGLVEQVGREHGVEHPIQMTVATTRRCVPLGVPLLERAASPAPSSSAPTFARLRAMHPEIELLGEVADESRLVVSEPLGDRSRAPGMRCRSRATG